MLDRPQIVQTEGQSTAVIRLTIPRAEIQTVMGPAIAEVMAAVTAQGLAPAGPVFSHHLRMDPDTFDFEVGVPVKAPVSATGRVNASQLPAATVRRTVYHAPYEGRGSREPNVLYGALWGPAPASGDVRRVDCPRGKQPRRESLGVLRRRSRVE